MPAKEGIRRQIHLAEEFVRAHPSWVIARDPKEAARAHEQGKKILVFSLEGAGGILETEDDIREFIDHQGIRIVTFAHLSDDELSGAALMHGYRALGNPLGLIASLLQGRRGCRGEHLNPNGMTKRGRDLLHALLRRGVWIDLAHASEATHAELAPLVKAAGQPLLYTHIMLREHRNGERSLSAKQLEGAARSAAVIGLIPGESSVGDAPVPPENCPARCAGRCKGGVFALAAEYNEMVRALGPRSVFLGSDFNGAMDHLRPSAPDCALGSTIDARGFSNISQTAELWRDLAEASALSEENEQDGVANFLRAWAKVRPKK
jgi:microsomal dipeptidase-like Zn-dependent dipeptidase